MKKLIMANWKMNLTIKESLELAKQFSKKINGLKNEVVICPDFSALAFVGPVLKGSRLLLGAQDSAGSNRGAYTGEVLPLNLKILGTKYVILGHSERREHLHEDSNIINNKIKYALENKLKPVLCVGESLVDKKSGETLNYLTQELRRTLKGIKIKMASDLVIAYEPVWAISTNKRAKPMEPIEANLIHEHLRKEVQKILKYSVRIIYGGSVNEQNAALFLEQPNVDGLLVGGASLKLGGFAKIVD